MNSFNQVPRSKLNKHKIFDLGFDARPTKTLFVAATYELGALRCVTWQKFEGAFGFGVKQYEQILIWAQQQNNFFVSMLYVYLLV